MVTTGQMQHAMENQHLHFVRNRVAVTYSILGRDGSANSYVAPFYGTRKRKNIRGFFLPAKTAIELAHSLVAGDHDIHLTAHPGQSLSAPREAFKLRPDDIVAWWADEDQGIAKKWIADG